MLSQAGISGGQVGIRAVHQAAVAHSEPAAREESPARERSFPVDRSPASPTVTSRTTGKVAQGPCASPSPFPGGLPVLRALLAGLLHRRRFPQISASVHKLVRLSGGTVIRVPLQELSEAHSDCVLR